MAEIHPVMAAALAPFVPKENRDRTVAGTPNRFSPDDSMAPPPPQWGVCADLDAPTVLFLTAAGAQALDHALHAGAGMAALALDREEWAMVGTIRRQLAGRSW